MNLHDLNYHDKVLTENSFYYLYSIIFLNILKTEWKFICYNRNFKIFLYLLKNNNFLKRIKWLNELTCKWSSIIIV